MHGFIILQLQKFAQQQAGPQAWDTLLREAKLPPKSYSPVRTYPDEEAFALVGAASRVLNLPASTILEAFGEFIAPELIRLYGRLLQPEWKTLDVIEHTETLIHAAVRVGNPGAKPPVLECIRTTENELQIMYSSERQMCSLATGIVKSLARHFGETILVTDDACTLKGDPFCVLQVTQCKAEGAPTQILETVEAVLFQDSTPISGADLPVQAVSGSGVSFLEPPLRSDELGRLAGFRVLQIVGQGGMGITFRAHDSRLNRVVALKVMQPRLVSDTVMRARFLREARAMAAIKSDHVVTVYEVGVANAIPFLAMEFLDGVSLEDYRKNVGKLPLPQVVRIGREVAHGLAAAHTRGLIHRDINPSNLWLESPTGRVKILDFGLAHVDADPEHLSQVGTILGTPAFMAPEQARGDTIDHRADLFSLGCVLYELCTNERPFNGTDVLCVLTALATHKPPPPQAMSAEVPTDFSDLIMQLLQKKPDQRPASSQALADALADIERSLGVPLG